VVIISVRPQQNRHMTKINVSRPVDIPDILRLSRYRKIPELGPRLLFFSGGTALTGLSKTLKNYTHNSIHLVSPFDSGGSSAKLRSAFNMPAIGDLRSRLIALADETILGHPEIYRLFSYRLPENKSQAALETRLTDLVAGKDALIEDIANPMRTLICHQLGYFLGAMPADFNLKGASIGNLIITGGYINNHKQLEPILFLFSKLVNVLGVVRPITNDNYHLVVNLKDGKEIIGQHLMTGKEAPAITSSIQKLSLSKTLDRSEPVSTKLRKRNRKLIEQADLICYPPGSFFSSLIANLLPKGVGKAISSNGAPKVYIPNLGNDPELFGLSLQDTLETLLYYLQQDSKETKADSFINFIVVDSEHGHYPSGIPIDTIQKLGITLIDTKLMNKGDTHYDDERLVSVLLSLT
jgi:CofD-related protein of GAK system